MRYFKSLFFWAKNSLFKAKKVVQIGASLPAYYKIAMSEIGVLEYPGDKHNPRIIEYHSHTNLKATTDEVPWCASFVCWCLDQAGYNHPHSASARSFLDWGNHCEATEGCVVVLSRPPNDWSGHVGFFVKRNRKYVWLLGGNQSNRVGIQKYHLSRVLDYRKL